MAGAAPLDNWEAAADQVTEQVAGLSIGPAMLQPPASPERVDQPQQGASGDSSGPGSVGLEGAAPGAEAATLVDHALRDALCHPKNRASVLKLEEEVEAFVLSSQAPQYIFSRDMTSYERLLAHRTAQHWGLETTTISQGPDQGKIVAYRGPHARVPKVKLSQVPVSIEELPSGATLSSPGSPVPAPRVLVRKRPDRLGPRGAGLSAQQADYLQAGVVAGLPYADGAAAAGFRSVEERQQEYHRARARIFGGEGASAYMQQPQQLGLPPGAQAVYGTAGGLPASPMHSPFPVSPPRPAAAGGYGAAPAGWVPMGAGGRGGGAANGGRKAVLRNKSEDMNDPDFRRNRSGPRFDPGFGEETEAQQSIYIRPTYSSEFPELGGQQAPAAGRSSSRGGGGGGPRRTNGALPPPPGGAGPHMAAGASPMAAAAAGMAYAMPPYGTQMPGGMVAAGPMGHFMVPPGMVVAGPMPGGMAGMYAGGAAMPFHPAAAGYYQVPAPGGWGYYPVQGGGGQEGMAMQYAVPFAYPGMGAHAAMAGFPGGPAAAAAMAAMAGPVPGPVPLSPHGSGALSPHHSSSCGMSRQRSNGARSRNSVASSRSQVGSPLGTPRRQLSEAVQQADLPPAAAASVAPTAEEAATGQQHQQQAAEGDVGAAQGEAAAAAAQQQ
ncbi:hypothetical protein N2152v2_010772 [Parachlorella kessleri]